MRLLRYILGGLLIMVITLILVVNIKLYYVPKYTVSGSDTVNVDLVNTLQGLKHSIADSADVKMQALYPEGYIFLNAMYGLSWCNLLDNLDQKSEYFKEGHTEIQKSYDKINSEVGRSAFTEELPLPYGAFYNGWSSYLLGQKLKLEGADVRDPLEISKFKEQCHAISTAIALRPYPATYYGKSWPADAIICIAALSLHDKIFKPEYTMSISNWVSSVKLKVDHSGLIPHEVDPLSGKSVQNARGSSQGLILVFLKEIDEQFAEEQYKLYSSNFIDTMFGLSGVREYAKDEYGLGDVDSGPMIFQFGAASTIVGMQTSSLYGDRTSSLRIRNAVEALTFPMTIGKEKKYLLGQLPMADVFIAWANSQWSTQEEYSPKFIGFNVYSFIITSLLFLLSWIILRKR